MTMNLTVCKGGAGDAPLEPEPQVDWEDRCADYCIDYRVCVEKETGEILRYIDPVSGGLVDGAPPFEETLTAGKCPEPVFQCVAIHSKNPDATGEPDDPIFPTNDKFVLPYGRYVILKPDGTVAKVLRWTDIGGISTMSDPTVGLVQDNADDGPNDLSGDYALLPCGVVPPCEPGPKLVPVENVGGWSGGDTIGPIKYAKLTAQLPDDFDACGPQPPAPQVKMTCGEIVTKFEIPFGESCELGCLDCCADDITIDVGSGTLTGMAYECVEVPA